MAPIHLERHPLLGSEESLLLTPPSSTTQIKKKVTKNVTQ